MKLLISLTCFIWVLCASCGSGSLPRGDDDTGTGWDAGVDSGSTDSGYENFMWGCVICDNDPFKVEI